MLSSVLQGMPCFVMWLFFALAFFVWLSDCQLNLPVPRRLADTLLAGVATVCPNMEAGSLCVAYMETILACHHHFRAQMPDMVLRTVVSNLREFYMTQGSPQLALVASLALQTMSPSNTMHNAAIMWFRKEMVPVCGGEAALPSLYACPTTTVCKGIVRLQRFDAWVRDSGGHISGHHVFVAGGMGNGIVTVCVPLVAQRGL